MNNSNDLFTNRVNRLEDKKRSMILVAITILLTVFLNPILAYFMEDRSIDWLKYIAIFMIGIGAYLVDGIILWLVGKCFKSEISLISDCFEKWGTTFLPNVFVGILVALTERMYYLLIDNTVLGIFLSFLAVFFLVWKMLLFYLYINSVMHIQGGKAIVLFFILGIIFIIWSCVQGRLGLQVPII